MIKKQKCSGEVTPADKRLPSIPIKPNTGVFLTEHDEFILNH